MIQVKAKCLPIFLYEGQGHGEGQNTKNTLFVENHFFFFLNTVFIRFIHCFTVMHFVKKHQIKEISLE